jgi:hypothetical protein
LPHLGCASASLGDEAVADAPHRLQHLRGFRDQLPPVLAPGLAEVDGDHPAARSAEVGTQPEDRAVVADQVIGGVEVGEQVAHRRIRLGEVLVGHAVRHFGPLPDEDHEVAAVLGDDGDEAQVLTVRPPVDQAVLLLLRAQAVVVELLVVVGVLNVRPHAAVVAAVIEALPSRVQEALEGLPSAGGRGGRGRCRPRAPSSCQSEPPEEGRRRVAPSLTLVPETAMVPSADKLLGSRRTLLAVEAVEPVVDRLVLRPVVRVKKIRPPAAKGRRSARSSGP